MSEKNPGGYDVFKNFSEYESERERLKWEGNFDEYITKVVEDPSIVRTSHQTVYQAVTSRPDFFTTGRNALFGAEDATEQFIEVLKGGAEGLEIGKRIVLLVGPPGSGKSTLVNGTKRGLEEYSKTDQGATYAISDCPMQEEPLHLIPNEMRSMLESKYGFRIDGDLCPHCKEKYGDDLTAETLKNVPVSRVFLSEKDRKGIANFKPSDPKSQDITELVGSIDLSKIGEFGKASDARAYSFDGKLNIANRGVMEFVEMLKCDPKFLYSLLDLTQDRVITSPRFADISADEVILAHTNLTEYRDYVNNPKNEALRDRMVTIEVGYNLRVSDEKKIHDKLIGQSEMIRKSSHHISPGSLDTAAMFAVLTRIAESETYSKMQKVKIYDGQDVDGLTQRDLRELREKGKLKQEGMSGISPRFVIDSLSTALVKDGVDCLTPRDTIMALRDNIERHPHTQHMKPEEKQAILDDLTAAKDEYDEFAKREVQSAFVYSYEENARVLCDNYLNNVEAFCSRSKVIDKDTDEEYEPNEKLMRSIEEQIGISDNGKKEFRSELMTRIGAMYRRGEVFDYASHARLKEAIEKKLFADMKDVVQLTTSSKVPNEKQQKKISEVERSLIEDKGYCSHCAPALIKHVGNLLSK